MALQSPERRKIVSALQAQELADTSIRQAPTLLVVARLHPLLGKARHHQLPLPSPSLHKLLPSRWRLARKPELAELGCKLPVHTLHVFQHGASPRRRRP